MLKTYIKRKYYVDKIKPFIGKDLIKVVVGQRRVGKSYLLLQIMDEIRSIDKKANIIYIDKELNEFERIKEYQNLIDFVKQQTKPKRKNYVFIDEVQDIEKFEKALRNFNAQTMYDVYVTGSNAKLLSGELSTYLSGRCIELKVFGLSYEEFLFFHKLKNNNDSLLKYTKYGGLPYLVNLDLDDEVVYDYLRNVYNTILYKDVVTRHQIRNPSFLERLIEYLADNTGSLISSKKISDFLKSQKISITPNMVLDYLSFLGQAFFVFKVPRADIQGKKIFEINDKYYFEDLGLRHSVVGYKQTDINKILENLVFLHLKTAGYKIAVGKMMNREVDFVCEKQGERVYVQVAYLITQENQEREFGNLLAIPDNYPKIVVSMDEAIDKSKYKGIRQINVRDFLSGREIVGLGD